MPKSVDLTASLPAGLVAEIAENGFYPSLVAETVALGVGDREVLDHLVQHEATFTGHELHRHVTVLIRTATQLVICHVDEGEGARGDAVATTEIVALRAIDSVVLTRSMKDPERSSGLSEAWLTIVWGAARRVDLGPAACEDPNCDADHGYTGVIQPDDITVRMSPPGRWRQCPPPRCVRGPAAGCGWLMGFLEPRYGDLALANVLPSVSARLLGDDPVLALPHASKYVVLLVDGLGGTSWPITVITQRRWLPCCRGRCA